MIDHPESVAAIHLEYAEAGAEVLTTNTFRTRARSLVAAGLREDAAKLTGRAVAAARGAASDKEFPGSVWVAGSLAPLEDCYLPERVPDDACLAREHGELAEALQLPSGQAARHAEVARLDLRGRRSRRAALRHLLDGSRFLGIDVAHRVSLVTGR